MVAGCSPSVVRQLETWISLSEPPELFEFLSEALRNGPSEQSSVLLEGHVMACALLHPEALTVEQAHGLMEHSLAMDSFFDVKLLQRLLAGRAWPAEVPTAEIERCLALVELSPDPNRISVTLLKFARHPNPRVQSKAVKLLGRHLQSIAKLEELYLNPDERVRANLIEGLARRFEDSEAVLALVERAAKDPSNRVSTMALAVLARRGHKMSQTLLDMRRRSKVEAISWAANYAHETLLRPQQFEDLAALSNAIDAHREKAKSPALSATPSPEEVDGNA